MSSSSLVEKEKIQQDKMEAYYSFQSKIYDSTRWTFLFGRKALIKKLPALSKGSTILEVGCGTGANLKALSDKYPDSNIFALDTSKIMLDIASKKSDKLTNVQLLHEAYGIPSDNRPKKIDLIIFSYSLSMINPQWSDLIQTALTDLNPKGIIAVADFDKTPFGWFRRHMANNHVRMEGQISDKLRQLFRADVDRSLNAYFGVWKYMVFIGRKKDVQ